MGLSRNALLIGAVVLLLSQIILRFQPSTPKSLYQALGVPETASAVEITTAYDRLCATWKGGKDPVYVVNAKLAEVQHAYDVLFDEPRRRNYDIFQLDERLAEPTPELLESATISITSHNFGKLVLDSNETWVIQVYSEVSLESQNFVSTWERAAEILDGVAKLGRVEVGQLPLSILLAERSLLSKKPFFRSGLPEVVVFTPDCRQFDCLLRYRGVKSADALVEWLSTSVLKLPRILYYNSKTLMEKIIQGSGPQKVKIIVFSRTGERAAPYIRQAAKRYWEYAVFAMVLWQEPSATFWESRVGVESAPALVYVKDPGMKPFIHHGHLNSSSFGRLMEEHKTFELPQLRSISAEALGCDARGYSMAGQNTTTWYCVVVAGRIGLPLFQMRGILRGVLQNLTNEELRTDVPQHLLAAKAVKSKRLSISWLDGELQKDFCYFYLHSPTMFEACGPQRNGEVEDVPKIFLVRYQRKLYTPEELDQQEKNKALRSQNIWMALQEDDDNVASQLVSKYNGSAEIADIVQWMSQMVYEGDTNTLPSFTGKMPTLVEEEKLPFLARTQDVVADGHAKVLKNGQWLFQTIQTYNESMTMFPIFVIFAIFLVSHLILGRNKSSIMRQDLSADAAAQSDDNGG